MAQRRDGAFTSNLHDLIADIAKGYFQIPDLQREFVWDEEQRMKLCDSINQGLPIGCLLVWRTRDDQVLKSRDTIGKFKIPHPPEGNESHYYVIDGLQRLSTLFFALHPRAPLTAIESGSENVELCFDLGDPAPKNGSPICLYGEAQRASQRYIPLCILFDAERIREYQWGLLQAGRRDWLQESERLAGRFRTYEIPIVPLVSDKLNVVAETFVRINSAGESVGERDVLRALLWMNDLGLESILAESAAVLEPHGWGEIASDLMLSVLKAMIGADQYKVRPHDIASFIRERPEELRRFPEVLNRTVECLAEWGVCGPASLPYSYSFVAIARAIHRHGGDCVTDALPRLRRWFFQTSYGAYFTGITGNRLERAFEHVSSIVLDGQKDTRPQDLNREVWPAMWSVGGRRHSARAILLALRVAAEMDRRVRAEGTSQTRMNYGEMLQPPRLEGQPDMPHCQTLGQMGLKAFHLLHPAAPREDFASYVLCPVHLIAEIRGQLSRQVRLPFNPYTVVLSHYLISEKAADFLGRGDLESFLEIRRRELNDLEQDFVEELGLHWGPSAPF